MEIYAQFTILKNGSVWGTKDFNFSRDTLEEAKEHCKEIEETYCELSPNGEDKIELLFDYLIDEEGNEIDTIR